MIIPIYNGKSHLNSNANETISLFPELFLLEVKINKLLKITQILLKLNIY